MRACNGATPATLAGCTVRCMHVRGHSHLLAAFAITCTRTRTRTRTHTPTSSEAHAHIRMHDCICARTCGRGSIMPGCGPPRPRGAPASPCQDTQGLNQRFLLFTIALTDCMGNVWPSSCTDHDTGLGVCDKRRLSRQVLEQAWHLAMRFCQHSVHGPASTAAITEREHRNSEKVKAAELCNRTATRLGEGPHRRWLSRCSHR